MFSYSDPVADDAILSSVGSADAVTEARAALLLSRQAEARAVLLAFRIGENVHDDLMVGLSPAAEMKVRRHAEKAAVGEISVQLGLSRTKAGKWYRLGSALQHMAKLRMAYLAGEYSTNRMSELVHSVEAASDVMQRNSSPSTDVSDADGDATGDAAADDDDTDSDADPATCDPSDTADPADADAADAAAEFGPVMDMEDIALEYGARPTTDKVLRDELAGVVIGLDPEGAAEARKEFGRAWQNVTVTNDSSGHANIDACVPAEHGVFLREGIAALIKERLCRRDPRTLGQQRVEALAELIGTPGVRLACRCGGDDCPYGGAPTDPTSGPAGPTEPSSPGPDCGRDDDRDGDDAIDIDGPTDDGASEDRSDHADGDDAARDENLSDSAASAGGDQAADDVERNRRPASDREVDHDREPYPDPVADRVLEHEPAPDGVPEFPLAPVPKPWTLVLDKVGVEVPRLRGYGAIDPPMATDLTDRATLITLPDKPNRRTAGRIVVGERGRAHPVDPSGHGGHDLPPPGALTYAPSARLREQILLSDLYCRYPYCGRPAHECDLDHLVKFLRADPYVGGWTVPENLAPLCRPDHQRKHMGLWIPVMHVDRTITWRNPRTGREIVTYPR